MSCSTLSALTNPPKFSKPCEMLCGTMRSSREQKQASRSNKINPRQGGETKTSKKFPVNFILLVLYGRFFAVLSFCLCPSPAGSIPIFIRALITLFSYGHSPGEESLMKTLLNVKFSKNDRLPK